MKQNEIKEQMLSKHPNINSEQYDLIISDFYKGIRHFVTNPLESKGGIMIGNLFTLWIDKNLIYKFIRKLKNKELKIDRYNRNNIEFYEALYKQLERYERQTSKKTYNERSS